MSNPLNDPAISPSDIARQAAEQIAKHSGVDHHDIALTLGSGWGRAAELMGETVAEFPATDIVGFSRPALEGHVGTIRSVKLPSGKHALIIGARTHYYEGHGVRRVVHSVRTAAATGATIMVLTNGAGGLNPSWTPGTPVLIRDHINMTATSPLEGATFIDLTDLYSSRLRDIVKNSHPELDEGVYVQLPGPHYETPAEVSMVGVLGGTLVGMSTALEAIAAREAGMEVVGFSLVTNLAAGISDQPLSHNDVIEAGQAAEPVISALLADVVGRL